MTEEERLRDCLCYIASCCAATLECAPNSMSKSQKRRHKGIAEKALAFLEGGAPDRAQGVGWTADRLARAIAEIDA